MKRKFHVRFWKTGGPGDRLAESNWSKSHSLSDVLVTWPL